MREPKEQKQDLHIYELQPPEFVPKLSSTADLGYVGFDPPRPGQAEDVLSDSNIKYGYHIPRAVTDEYSVGAQLAQKNLVVGETISALESLMGQIFARREVDMASILPHAFRMPSRVTLNDAKRQQWFADLANPDVPLAKLGKSVPHGAKGQDLLELLQSKNVAIPRAVWFLRVFGANEQAGLRNKPSYDPTQYSVEWTGIVTGWMKKQLGEIALPMAPRLGLNIKQTFKGVLSDPESRNRWISKFTYCLDLLRIFYTEGLIDSQTFLSWLVQQMSSCNLAQASFVARLADEYLQGILVCRALTRPFVSACLAKLSEIHACSMPVVLSSLESLLKHLLQRACLALPDAFVSPRMWVTHSGLLDEILSAEPLGNIADAPGTNAFVVKQRLWDNYLDVKARNEALLFQNMPPPEHVHLGRALCDVQVLNSISSISDIDNGSYFDSFDALEEPDAFASKLDTLLCWVVTSLQYGDHRPYVAVTLISRWHKRAQERATRRDARPPSDFLQDRLFDWLDTADIVRDDENIRAVSQVYGELVERGLFSYTSYLQRLIARGELGLSNTQESTSFHRSILRWIPLYKASAPLVSQRKLTLYGVRARNIPEDANDRAIRKDLRRMFSEIFEGGSAQTILSVAQIRAECEQLMNCPRFEQVRTVTEWFLKHIRSYLSRCGAEVDSGGNVLKTYCTAIAVLEGVKCYRTILDITLHVLDHVRIYGVVTSAIDTLRRYMTIWSCMDVSVTVTASLHSAYQHWQKEPIHARSLLPVLLEVDGGKYLDDASRERLLADVSRFKHGLLPETERPDAVPVFLSEILDLITDHSPALPSALAERLWYKYRTAADWGWKVWDNTIASLRQVPVHPVTQGNWEAQRACALRYGFFLLLIDQHLPNGLDEQVHQWCMGSGQNEINALSPETWQVVHIMVLFLLVQGALTAPTILQGMVYPAWKLSADASLAGGTHVPLVFLRASIALLHDILLRDSGTGEQIPPSDLCQLLRLQSRRADTYKEPHFSLMVRNIPFMILIEEHVSLPEDIRSSCSSLRRTLCLDSAFRMGAYRNLSGLRESFEQCLESESIPESLHEPLINGLRMILDNTQSAPGQVLSPCTLAARAIEMKFVLRKINKGLSEEATRQAAMSEFDRIVSGFFRNPMNSEQADFVAEMARGVGDAVTAKFVNYTLRCIADFIAKISPDLTKIPNDAQARVSELFRMLTHLVEVPAIPEVESSIQDSLITCICEKLEALEIFLSSTDNDSQEDRTKETDFAVLLCRVLQYALRSPSAWTPLTKGLSARVSSVIFKLALLLVTGQHMNIAVHSLHLDTLYCILDETPVDSKFGISDMFYLYPRSTLSELPSGIPPEYRARIRSLLPYGCPNSTVSHLAIMSKDGDTDFSQAIPVQNRPWEWVEYLGEQCPADVKDEHDASGRSRSRGQHFVKNTASLPLELFNARRTGDSVVGSSSARLETTIRSFEDGLSSESFFKRDWRESRVQGSDGGLGHMKADDDDDGSSGPALNQTRTSTSSRMGSPASSIVSRSSAHGTNSLRPSPGVSSRASGSIFGESMDADITSTTPQTSAKRKSSVIQEDDAGSSSRPAKKAKTNKAASKPRTKKR